MYSKILIVSGTTEGRELSDKLSQNKIEHYVSVASSYGENMMAESPYSHIQVGRLDKDEMISYLNDNGFDKDSIIIDATHPYAVVVSENCKAASDELGIKYIRVIRDSIDKEGSYNYYPSIKECAEAIAKTEGNVLLTTGSKELGDFVNAFSDKDRERIYVRVLPSIQSISLCVDAGIAEKNIIAMHGPFSVDMNKALFEKNNIKHLVTKESGANGGFEEKLMAADLLGIKSYIISRPVKEEGVTLWEAYDLFNLNENGNITVTLAGIGMGSDSVMTKEVREAISDADAVFGADRLLKSLNITNGYALYMANEVIPVIEKNKYNNVIILFSGDTGFYSGAKKMTGALREWNEDINIKVLPGISSVSYLASKLSVTYEDACIYSLHGRGNVITLINKIRYNEKTFALLSNDEDIRSLGTLLDEANIDAVIYAGSNLSYSNEEITELSLKEASKYHKNGVITAYIVNKAPENEPLIKVKKDCDFIRDKVPMTKECIRHESIIALNLKKNDVVYDIGGGTGSVAIEIAGLDDSLKVYTVEKKKEAVELINANKVKHNAHNLTVEENDAVKWLNEILEARDETKYPDAVFIGGSSGELKDILSILGKMRSNLRVVINAVSLETISEVNELIKNADVKDVKTIQLQLSHSEEVGAYHLMKAENPVVIFSFVL